MSTDGCFYCISDRLFEGCSALRKPVNQLSLDKAPQPSFSFAHRVRGHLTQPRPTYECSAIHAKNICCFIWVEEVFTFLVQGVWRTASVRARLI
jgi:hypothetical protein